MTPDLYWTPERVQQLRDLWAEGATTSEIGRRIGCGKNAIIGKAWRLKLDARPSPIRRDVVPKAIRFAAPIPPDMRDAILDALDSGLGEGPIVQRLGCSFHAVRRVRHEAEAKMIRSEFQPAFELIVIERPRPPVVLPKWVSMAIPPAKSCCWVEAMPGAFGLDGFTTTRARGSRTWVYCDDPNVEAGSSYCREHDAISCTRKEREMAA
jgi:GcrA cell cycle regulator